MRRFLLLMLMIIIPISIFAVEDIYPFKNSLEQERFFTLTHQLRCLVCQNQNLAESNAPLANDLRDQIYYQISKGETDQAIIDYLVTRYGNFILYRPPLSLLTIGLWFGPFLLLFFTIAYLIYYLRIKQSVK